jgi:hypothetical protein
MPEAIPGLMLLTSLVKRSKLILEMKAALAPVNGILQPGRKALEDPSPIIESLSITKYSPAGKGFYGFVSPEELSEERFLRAAKDGELVVKAIAFFNDSIVSVNNTKNQGNMEYHCFTFRGYSKLVSLAKYSMENFFTSFIRKSEGDSLIYEVMLKEEDYFFLEYISKTLSFDYF